MDFSEARRTLEALRQFYGVQDKTGALALARVTQQAYALDALISDSTQPASAQDQAIDRLLTADERRRARADRARIRVAREYAVLRLVGITTPVPGPYVRFDFADEPTFQRYLDWTQRNLVTVPPLDGTRRVYFIAAHLGTADTYYIDPARTSDEVVETLEREYRPALERLAGRQVLLDEFASGIEADLDVAAKDYARVVRASAGVLTPEFVADGSVDMMRGLFGRLREALVTALDVAGERTHVAREARVEAAWNVQIARSEIATAPAALRPRAERMELDVATLLEEATNMLRSVYPTIQMIVRANEIEYDGFEESQSATVLVNLPVMCGHVYKAYVAMSAGTGRSAVAIDRATGVLYDSIRTLLRSAPGHV